MNVTCTKCGTEFDDARRNTICPHPKIMSDADMDQKDAGLALIGKDIVFNHQPDGPIWHVQSVAFDGMVTLCDLPGNFAPHLFTVKK